MHFAIRHSCLSSAHATAENHCSCSPFCIKEIVKKVKRRLKSFCYVIHYCITELNVYMLLNMYIYSPINVSLARDLHAKALSDRKHLLLEL